MNYSDFIPIFLYILNTVKASFYYNTTSGSYEAKLIHIQSVEDNTVNYVHKLESVPYGEKPKRFQRSVMKKFLNGKHNNQRPVICPQVAYLTSYGPFIIKNKPEVTEGQYSLLKSFNLTSNT